MDDNYDPMKDIRPRVTVADALFYKSQLTPLPDWLLPALGYTTANGESGNGHADPEAIIRQGKRDVTLTSMAGAMRAKGFTEAAILSALLVENENRCIPCLSTAQVEKIAHSVARYDPDPFANVIIKGVTPANGQHGGATAAPEPQTVEIIRVPASQLVAAEPHAAWFWRGYMAKGGITLFSALWKSGKTTLLAHLLKGLGDGGSFCGQQVQPARVVYVTEESQSLWAARRDKVRFGDWCEFIIKPFMQKPTFSQWYAFIDALRESLEKNPADLLIFDPISNLWPVKDENSASEVTTALMPLRTLDPNECRHLTLVHHLRKGDGLEATGSRGSGALTGFVDTILELRRFHASDNKDRRRVLTAHGRYEETPAELVVQLSNDGSAYTTHGDRAECAERDIIKTIIETLPVTPPGITIDQLEERWPGETSPKSQRLKDALREGTNNGLWIREGSGLRGSPFMYYRPAR